MEVDFVILADGAHVAGEKLYVLGGGWTNIWAREFPTVHQGSIAVGMMVPWNETNRRHSVEIVLLNSDGQQVGDPLVSGEFEVGRPPGMPQGVAQRFMVAATVNFAVERPGQYEVVIRVNGEDMRRSEFTATQAPAVPPPTQ